jgi:hypothetical protein
LVRFSFPNLFKAKDVSDSHADWPKVALLAEPFFGFSSLIILGTKDLFSFEVK